MTHRDPDLTHPDDDPTALFWCWTENEPSTFRCRERHHDVRAVAPGRPLAVTEITNEWDPSTSALLRQTQAALAASQADLTSTMATVVELLSTLDAFQVASGADRNAALQTGIEAVRQMRFDLALARAHQASVTAERDEALAKLAKPCGSCHPCDAYGSGQDRDLARAELASARQELEQLRAELATKTTTQENPDA